MRFGPSLQFMMLLAITNAAALSVPVLAGCAQGIPWALYGARGPEDAPLGVRRVHLSTPPKGRLLGANYRNDLQRAVLAYRLEASTGEAFRHHDRQLRAQGFVRVSLDQNRSSAEASYTRDGMTLLLLLERRGGAQAWYRAELDFSAASSAALHCARTP